MARRVGMLLFLFGIVLSGIIVSEAADLPQLNVEGTHYEVGLQIGKYFKQRIQDFVNSYSNLKQVLLPFYQSPQGKVIIDGYVAENKRVFPGYFDEMKGFSDGANVPLETIYLLNLENEVGAFTNASMKPNPELTHCTDMFAQNEDHSILGHNEDSDALVKQYAYLVHTVVKDARNQTISDFIGYYYPGYLAGEAWGWNAHGLVFSENALFPKNASERALANAFLAREAYDAHSLEDVIRTLNRPNRAAGFSLNVGILAERRILNIEFSNHGVNSKEIHGNYSHTNLYKHLITPQNVGPSSVHRDARIDELPAVQTATDVKTVLGDTKDPQYPIYRNANPPDCCVTAATVVYDLRARTSSVYLTNPKLTQPYKVFNL